jgi:hydroxymethylbilane synthase
VSGRLRIGTRGSWLALLQSGDIARRLGELGHEAELVKVVTEGDRRPIDMSPGVGVFVTAIEQALMDGTVDVAVHSAKDVPLVMRDGLTVAAFPNPREDPQDALVTVTGDRTLGTLPPGAVFGTDSPRRAGFVLSHRPDLRHRPVHGNVDTRLRRLADGEVDALVLAVAGLIRMGARRRIAEYIHPEVLPPAPGQGALALQCRADDARALQALGALDDPAVRLAVETERRVLEATGGSCRAPVGALAAMTGGRLCLLAGAAAPDGSARCVLFLDSEPDAGAGAEMAGRAGEELMNKVVSRVA